MEENKQLPIADVAAAQDSKHDPEPQPPIEPPLEACCNSACSPCIFDLYAEEMNEYRQAHLAWKARQAAK
ncbi:oxidoreductase-like domain-containing protein [Chitinibacter sp. SCUT-21]|uniref:oxidoreductase-like domain-containing protein n=1 Tax=Chitinibacter sp. SCUT-21 TaxID=2970891 RepID=UPI0035A64A28